MSSQCDRFFATYQKLSSIIYSTVMTDPISVYLIHAENTSLYKIGITRNIQKRLSAFNTHCPYKIKLVCCIKMQEARAMEVLLHKRYKKCQTNLEWFNLANSQANEIISLLQSFSVLNTENVAEQQNAQTIPEMEIQSTIEIDEEVHWKKFAEECGISYPGEFWKDYVHIFTPTRIAANTLWRDKGKDLADAGYRFERKLVCVFWSLQDDNYIPIRPRPKNPAQQL